MKQFKTKRKLSLEHAQQYAFIRGGQCLSDTYVDNKTKMLWQCSKGHRWKTVFGAVIEGKWCPKCVQIANSLSIADLQHTAEMRGGKCLSTQYVPSEKVLWQCAEGHRWRSTVKQVRHAGRWCPRCARSRGVTALTKEGNVISTWASIQDAAYLLGVDPGNISSVLIGNRKTAGGFLWQYADQDETKI